MDPLAVTSTRPKVYRYVNSGIYSGETPTGWYVECFVCRFPGVYFAGPFPTAAAANDHARHHITTTH